MTIVEMGSETRDVPVFEAGDEVSPGYWAIELLSRGNDLDVYDAWSAELQTRCVVKMLRPDRMHIERLTKRLQWEAELLTSLHHPHLVRGYEWRSEPLPMVAMETISGYTLQSLLARQRTRLPTVVLGCLGEQLCAALHYLHARDILHLDLKPGNVVSEAGKAKVIDFSLAHAPGKGPAGWGTPIYMAPEQAAGEMFTTASDVWAVGLMIYEAATGHRPFGESTSGSNSTSHAFEPSSQFRSDGRRDRPRYVQLEQRAAPALSLRRLPAHFANALDRCLARDPADRPSVDELLEVFRSVQHHTAVPKLARAC
jgi:eukaryotic-like serine/threonine-protein kinase